MNDPQLTPHFKLSEFLHPGDPMPPANIVYNLTLLAQRLQAVRDLLGKPVQITSGYRTAAHNARIPGAAANSYHLRGMAADIVVPGMSPEAVTQFLSGWSGGLGGYPTHTHVDTRPYQARWGMKPKPPSALSKASQPLQPTPPPPAPDTKVPQSLNPVQPPPTPVMQVSQSLKPIQLPPATQVKKEDKPMMNVLRFLTSIFLGKEFALALTILSMVSKGINAVGPGDLAAMVYNELPKNWKAPVGPATQDELQQMITRGIDFYRSVRFVLTV